MIVINTVSDTKFSFNGITYHKNFMPFVTGDKIAILNVYDACITLTDAPTHFSEYVVNGVTYTSVEALQAALLDVIYTRVSLGAGGSGTVTSVGLTMPSAFAVANSPITNAGTLAVTAIGTASQYIRGDGNLADFPTGGGGGGSSVSYYLNGSVNQGTFGGNVYKEMNKVPVFGAGTDITINANGYIAQFLTDPIDPNSLLIPAGNWNFETYFSASSGGGTPSFYVELYKYDGTTFTLIASSSATPELIAFGTNINPYFSSLAVPETVLTATDRLAIRIYVTHSGRTITLHTENSHLCQIITTFTTGLQSLNGLTKQTQYFAVGTSGSNFNISSSFDTHTFNLPTASSINRGALSSADWITFNNKQNAITLTTTGASGASTLIGSTLNIPNYTLAGLGGQPQLNGTGFVKVSGTTVSYDNSSYVPTSRTLTINGTAFDLSANRAWTIPTHDAVTIGTANGLSLSGQVLSMALASGSVTGALSSANWTTFNNKQNALNGTGFVKISGTTISYDNSSYALASAISGTTNYLAKFTSANVIGNSLIYDNGTNVGIGTASPTELLHLQSSQPVIRYTKTGVLNWKAGLITGNDYGITPDNIAGTALTIQSGTGNVGIGTTSPQTIFDIFSGSNNAFAASIGTSLGIGTWGGIHFGYNESSNSAYRKSAIVFERLDGAARGTIHILNNNVSGPASATLSDSKVAITSGGNVLIGTTTDNGAKLQVNGAATFGGTIKAASTFNSYTADGLFNINAVPSAISTPSGGNKILFGYWDGGSGQYYGRIGFIGSTNWSIGMASNNTSLLISTNNNGSLGAGLELASSGAATFSSSVTSTGFFVSSDITLKTLTKDKFDASKIDAISYKWNVSPQGKTLVGYSAQDVQKYMPDAVNTDSNGKLSVDYIQVLVQKIAHLETELKSLKNGLE